MPYIRSLFAKNIFQIEKTKTLRQRLISEPNLRVLCGFQKVPSESAFSRAYAFLSAGNILEVAHQLLIKKAYEHKTVYHVCRDSSAIAAREKAVKPAVKEKKPHGKRGRPAKNAIKPEKEPSVLEKQIQQDAAACLEEISKACAWGCKINSQGNVHAWKGYKLHLDVSDIGIPLTAVVTAANVHDSRLAIPLEKLTEQRVLSFYSLMDSAYDAKAIDAFIRSRGRIPIIDPNRRNGKGRAPLEGAKKERYKIRTAVERAYSHLKDHLLPKNIYVKGHKKISLFLMSAVICFSALKYLQIFIC